MHAALCLPHTLRQICKTSLVLPKLAGQPSHLAIKKLGDAFVQKIGDHRLVFALRLFRPNYDEVRVSLRSIFSPTEDPTLLRALASTPK